MGWFRKEKPLVETQPAERLSALGTHALDGTTPEQRVKRRSALLERINNDLARTMPKIPQATNAVGTVLDEADDFTAIKDAYRLGQPNISDALFLWYAQQGFIGYQMCAIIAQHWLVNKACTMPARDAIRKGFRIVSADGEKLDPEIIKGIERADKRMRLKQHLVQYIRKGRIFGIRILLFKVRSSDPDYYEKPFNIDGVQRGSYRGMVQVDPYFCAPQLERKAVADPASAQFYQPTYWLINGKRYHHSHFCIYIPDEVMDFLKPSYIYGGLSLPQKIMERVYAAERTANEGPLLAMTKRTTVLKTNAAAAIANKEQFDANLARFIELRDNMQVKVIDREEDDMEQYDISIADLDAVIMNQYQLTCSIAEVPATRMLGVQPKGFNSTGEFEESSYHETLETIQEDMNEVITRHHELLIKSEGIIDAHVSIEFNPLDAPTAKEVAETNYIKAQTDVQLVEAGAIDGQDVNARIRGDQTSGYAGIEVGDEDAEEEFNEEENAADAQGRSTRGSS